MHLLAMAALVLVSFLVASILMVVPVMLGIDVQHGTGLMVAQCVAQLVMFMLPVVLMVNFYYRDERKSFLRLDFSGRKWLTGLAGVVILVLLIPAIDWLTVWNDGWDLGAVGAYLRAVQEKTEGVTEELMSADSVGGLFANLLVVAVVPALCEELLFRGGIQNLLERWFGRSGKAWATHAAVWVTAIIFSLIHGELFSFMPRLLLGALLGYIYVYSGSILCNMLAHFVNNAIVVVAYWLVARGVLDMDLEEHLRIGWMLTAACSVGAVALFVATFVSGRDRKAINS